MILQIIWVIMCVVVLLFVALLYIGRYYGNMEVYEIEFKTYFQLFNTRHYKSTDKLKFYAKTKEKAIAKFEKMNVDNSHVTLEIISVLYVGTLASYNRSDKND